MVKLGALFLSITLAGTACLGREATAAAASVADIVDFINREGGWLASIDNQADNISNWFGQLSYKATTATGSNNTTIIVTRTPLLFRNKTKVNAGEPCAADVITTDTIMIDFRELADPGAPKQTTESLYLHSPQHSGTPDRTFNVWQVSLMMNGGRNIINVTTAITAPACPIGGVTWDLKGNQTSVASYVVEFPDVGQANYFVMLIQSALASLAPPRRSSVSDGPASK